MDLNIFMYMYIYIYIYIHNTCIYICIYIYIYDIYTYMYVSEHDCWMLWIVRGFGCIFPQSMYRCVIIHTQTQTPPIYTRARTYT